PAAVDLDRVVTVINGRLENMGRAEKLPNRKIDVGLYGNLSPEESEWMKRLISDSGHLEFRITADPNLEKNESVVKLANELPPDQTTLIQNGSPVAKWVGYSEREFGPIDREDNRIVKRLAGDKPDALVLIDAINVTGDRLNQVTDGVDSLGNPA